MVTRLFTGTIKYANSYYDLTKFEALVEVSDLKDKELSKYAKSGQEFYEIEDLSYTYEKIRDRLYFEALKRYSEVRNMVLESLEITEDEYLNLSDEKKLEAIKDIVDITVCFPDYEGFGDNNFRILFDD